MKKIIVLFSTIAMIAIAPAVNAEESLDAKLDRINQTIENLNDQKNNYTKEVSDVNNELGRINDRLVLTENKMVEVSSTLETLTYKLQDTNLLLEERKEALNEAQQGNQVRTAVQNMVEILSDSTQRSEMMKTGISLEEYVISKDTTYVELKEQKESIVDEQVILNYQLGQLKNEKSIQLNEKIELGTDLEKSNKNLTSVNEEITKALDSQKSLQKKKENEKKTAENKEKSTQKETNGFQAPLSQLVVTSTFGSREDPTGYSGTAHEGIDFSGSLNQEVYASMTGTVTMTGFDPSAGNYVIIKHDNGFYTYYMHLNHIQIAIGSKVNVGQTIGGMGTTGNSTGVHLHFGIATTAQFSGFVNPATYLGL